MLMPEAKKSNVRKVRVGFYLPSVFAAGISKAVEKGQSKKKIVADTMGIQRDAYMDCHECGERSPVRFFTRDQLILLYGAAKRVSYQQLLRKAEKLFARNAAKCVHCGDSVQLSPTTSRGESQAARIDGETQALGDNRPAHD